MMMMIVGTKTVILRRKIVKLFEKEFEIKRETNLEKSLLVVIFNLKSKF